MSKKINRIVSAALFLAVVLVLLFNHRSAKTPVISDSVVPSVSVSPEVTVTPTAAVTSYSFTATSSSQSALSLLQSQVELALKEYDFGTMINGVNGLLADEKHYWALYQNGDYAKTGIDDLVLDVNDTVELKYEEIKL